MSDVKKERLKENSKRWFSKKKKDHVWHSQYLEYQREYWKANGYKYRGRSYCGMRFRVLTRDQFTCRYCGRKAPNAELHVDHVFPRSAGGKNEIENLVTACVDCNLGKSDIILCK